MLKATKTCLLDGDAFEADNTTWSTFVCKLDNNWTTWVKIS